MTIGTRYLEQRWVDSNLVVETSPAWAESAWVASARPMEPDSRDACRAGRAAISAALSAADRVRSREVHEAWPYPTSIAESEGRGVAIAHTDPTRHVGIELARSRSVSPRFADCFATRRERQLCPFDDPAVLWTLKEAAWKALPCRPAIPFHAVETAWTSRGKLCGVRVNNHEIPARCLILLPWPGWILSVVCPGEGLNTRA